jgi:hypothetical protein
MVKGGKKVTVKGKFKQVDTGNYRVVGVNTWGEIYYRTKITRDVPQGVEWK